VEGGLTAVRGRRVLVTGGAGVIGRELLRILADADAEVLSVDRLPTEPPIGVVHQRADLAVDDIGFVWEFSPEIVFHLAASFERAEETPEFWDPNWRDNVVVSHRLAQGLSESSTSAEVIVFASSYLTYDPTQYLGPNPATSATPLSETARLDPRNLCGAAKLYAEKEYQFVADLLGGPRAVYARIFRVFGLGSRDVISRWTRSALRGEALTVYQAENAFDYVFARDVAEGLMKLAEAEAAAGPVNLATGVSTTIAQVLAGIRSEVGTELVIEKAGPVGQYEASRADIGLLERLTGWRPTITVEEGVRMIVEFERR
jgi:nucleoside-diphosphate-sugar epimerase